MRKKEGMEEKGKEANGGILVWEKVNLKHGQIMLLLKLLNIHDRRG